MAIDAEYVLHYPAAREEESREIKKQPGGNHAKDYYGSDFVVSGSSSRARTKFESAERLGLWIRWCWWGVRQRIYGLLPGRRRRRRVGVQGAWFGRGGWIHRSVS